MPTLRTAGLRPLLAALLVASCLLAALATLGAGEGGSIPPLVFVQRQRVPGSAVALGVGPVTRTLVTRGQLMVRETDGRFVLLVPEGRFYDVAHPSVSYDGRWIAFAAVTGRDSAWRIWKCTVSGREIQRVTFDDRGADPVAAYGEAAAKRFQRFDDFQPCWLPDGRIVFASTRYPLLAQAGVLASNLWVAKSDGTNLRRITAERDGAEAPSVDPVTGRLLYARWFFNRFRAADNDSGLVEGFTGALPADTVNLWQAGSIEFDGDHLRLAGGDPLDRAGQSSYQPIVLNDTTFVAVGAERGDLLRPTRLGLRVHRGRFGPGLPVAGLGTNSGWSACSPVALPDGRILFSYDWGGTGNFDLYVVNRDGRNLQPVVTDVHTLEMDAAVLAPRPLPPAPIYGAGWPDAPDALPHTTYDAIVNDPRTARFDCLNVFANAPVDAPFPSAVHVGAGLRLRFFAVLPRPLVPGGDSLVFLRDVPVSPQGAVHVDNAPADLPMFEQLVDAEGRVLYAGSGPAHVPGYNFTRPGAGTKCVGCHAGHSAMPVPASAADAEWTNLAPSARVTASSELRGTEGPAAIVDRRTVGEPGAVNWMADSDTAQWVRLDFPVPLEARTVVLYGMRSKSAEGGPLRVRRSQVLLFSGGREVKRFTLEQVIPPAGTRLEAGGLRIDALEFRPLAVEGRFRKRSLAALAEIETIARVAWE